MMDAVGSSETTGIHKKDDKVSEYRTLHAEHTTPLKPQLLTSRLQTQILLTFLISLMCAIPPFFVFEAQKFHEN
jgi:hypothetical protein